MTAEEVELGYLSIAISFAIGILCVRKIRSYDIHEPEPLNLMFLVAVYGGMASMAAAAVGYAAAAMAGYTHGREWTGYLLLVGPLEEAAKYLGLFATKRLFAKQMSEPLDGLVYMASVALGFSLIENFMYANSGDSSQHLIFLRATLATPAHILFSLPLGLAGYLAMRKRATPLMMAGLFAFSSLAHGLYDILCNYNLLAAVSLLILLWLQIRIILRYLIARSPHRRSLRESIGSGPSAKRMKQRGITCLHCGDDSRKPEFVMEELIFQECGNCGRYVLTRDNAFRLFHRLAPEFKNLGLEYHPSESHPGLHALYECIYVDDARKIGYFGMDAVDAKLDEITARIKLDSERKWLIAWVAKRIGVPDGDVRSERPETKAWREHVLFAMGLAMSVSAGVMYLKFLEVPMPGEFVRQKWTGKRFDLDLPQGWSYATGSQDHDSVEWIRIKRKRRATIDIRYQCWEIRPPEASQHVLRELKSMNGFTEIRRDTLDSWGRLKGSGLYATSKATLNQEYVHLAFAHSQGGVSLVIRESGFKAHLTELRPQMESIRNSIKLKTGCADDDARRPIVPDSATESELYRIFGVKR